MPTMADVGAAYQPFTEEDGWFIGEDKTLEWILDDGTVGSPPSGTGTWTFEWALRQRPEDPGDPILLKTPTLNGAVLTVEVAREDTLELPAGTYHYSLARTNAGNYAELAYGPATLLQPDTR